MKRFATVIACSWILGSGTLQAGPYVLGTPSTLVNTDGWALLAPSMSGFYAALTNSANFGSGGVVPTSFSITELNSFTSGDLAGLNGLLVPWWLDSEGGASAASIVAAFNSGMDLILFEDDLNHDPIGQALGLPTFDSDGSGTTAFGPFQTGPFGAPDPSSIYQSGNTGQKDAGTIAALGGFAGGINDSGQVTAAYWNRGTFNGNPNAGRLIIIADVDMASDYVATYDPLNNNGKFSLNAIAFALDPTNTPAATDAPEPATWLLMLVGAGACTLLRRRFTA